MSPPPCYIGLSFQCNGRKLDGRWFLLYWRLSHKLWPTVEDLPDSTIVPTYAGSTHTSIAQIVCAEETVRSLKTLMKAFEIHVGRYTSNVFGLQDNEEIFAFVEKVRER